MSESRPFTFDRVVRIIITCVVCAAAIWLIDYLKDVLLPFVVACLIAYILNPVVDTNCRILRLRHRAIGVFLTLFGVAFLIGLAAYFVVPSIAQEIRQMSSIVDKASSSDVSVPFVPKEIHDFVKKYIDDGHIRDILEGKHMETLLHGSTTFISGSIDFLMRMLEWLLVFIYVIFILLDYRPLMRGFRLMVPPKFRPVAYRVSDDIKNGMNRYFRGQAIIAAAAAVFYSIGFSIVGIPLAIVLGVLVGVLYMIPYFQYVTLIPVAVVCYISSMDGSCEFWPELGKCILVYVVSQCICDYILTPKIMGKAMGMNPAIILLSLSVWGSLLGLIGMIIALPVTALLLSYYEQYVIRPGNATR